MGRRDWYPLAYFIYSLACFTAIVLTFNMASFFLPDWGRILYGVWLAVGVAAVVRDGVEQGLPNTFWGNLRYVLRAHVWPIYSIHADTKQ